MCICTENPIKPDTPDWFPVIRSRDTCASAMLVTRRNSALSPRHAKGCERVRASSLVLAGNCVCCVRDNDTDSRPVDWLPPSLVADVTWTHVWVLVHSICALWHGFALISGAFA